MLYANYSTSDGGGIISAEQMSISILSLLTNRLRGFLRRVIYFFLDAQVNMDLQVSASSSVNNILIDTAGGVNVAKVVQGPNTKMTMEQVMAWNQGRSYLRYSAPKSH